MRKLNIVALLIGALLFASAHSAFADNIGYLDMERLFTNFKEGKDIQGDLQKRREAYQKVVEVKQKEIEKAKADKKPEEEIQKLITSVEADLKPKQEEILQYESEMQSRLVFKIKEISKSVAKRYGIDVVLDRRAVFSGGFDLTDFVVEKLNKGASDDVKETGTSTKKVIKSRK